MPNAIIKFKRYRETMIIDQLSGQNGLNFSVNDTIKIYVFVAISIGFHVIPSMRILRSFYHPTLIPSVLVIGILPTK